jgi:hypothetical protein
MHKFLLIQDALALGPLIDGRADVVCRTRVSSGHLHAGINFIWKIGSGYYARSPLIRRAQNPPMRPAWHCSTWDLVYFCVLANSFADAAFR